MNILIDFIPFQHPHGVGGALSFAKAVYDRLLERIPDGVKVFGVFDSNAESGRQYDYNRYAIENNISLLDISVNSISEMVKMNSISVFFIAFGQFYSIYDLSGITCRIVMFIHDIFDIERNDNKIDLCLHDKNTENIWQWTKRVANVLSGRNTIKVRQRYKQVIELFASPNTKSFTVSNYSVNALKYYFPQIKKEIHICYSPLRHIDKKDYVENQQLMEFLKSEKKYLFMIAANRIYKNAAILMKVMEKIFSERTDIFLLTLNYGKSIGSRHIDIKYLSDSDLMNAYKHAMAIVFPSFFEGFGYPPIESITCGTPVIASNVTSIPEILGDAGIYFSPFYPADLYRAINVLLNNKDCLMERMARRSSELLSKQQKDLDYLIDVLLNELTAVSE